MEIVMTDFVELRRMMVDGQLRTFDVQNSAVLDAMGRVPRECFVDHPDRGLAYADRPASLANSQRSLLAPMVLARMLQAGEVVAGERVLDICGGTGYSAAVMRAMGCDVVAWDPDPSFGMRAKQACGEAGFGEVDVIEGDTIASISKIGLFDVVLVNGCCEEEPKELFSRLADGGRLVAIMKNGAAQSVRVFRKSGNEIGHGFVGHGHGAMIELFAKKAEFVF